MYLVTSNGFNFAERATLPSAIELCRIFSKSNTVAWIVNGRDDSLTLVYVKGRELVACLTDGETFCLTDDSGSQADFIGNCVMRFECIDGYKEYMGKERYTPDELRRLFMDYLRLGWTLGV